MDVKQVLIILNKELEFLQNHKGEPIPMDPLMEAIDLIENMSREVYNQFELGVVYDLFMETMGSRIDDKFVLDTNYVNEAKKKVEIAIASFE